MSYLVDIDPGMVKVAQAIYAHMVAPSAPDIGLDYRILIERHGQPAAEVRRTRDDGIRLSFYADEQTTGGER